MSKPILNTWIMALVLAAACEPMGERPMDQPGGVPADRTGTQGTDDVTGDRGVEGATGTRNMPGTNGGAPTERGTVPSTTPAPAPTTVPGTAPGTAPAPMPGMGQAVTTEADQSTAQVVQDAHQMHRYQEEIARLAKAKSKDPAIQAYAEQAAREHKDADAKLTKLARDKDIPLGITDAARYQDQRDAEERLRALDGAMFDQAYVVEVIEGGDKNVMFVENNLTSTQDPQVKAYFVELQSVVRGQADRAKQLRSTQRGTK